jgi:hypothetical protein
MEKKDGCYLIDADMEDTFYVALAMPEGDYPPVIVFGIDYCTDDCIDVGKHEEDCRPEPENKFAIISLDEAMRLVTVLNELIDKGKNK